MPKSTWNPAEYATVAERIALFRAAYPFGFIRTYLHSRDDRQVTFTAEVYRHRDDPGPAATGWASERQGDGEINERSCLENAETSAIGRALANLGFAASKHRASFEEMVATNRRRADGRSLHLVREGPPRAAAPIAVQQEEPRRGPNAALQDQAQAVLEVQKLVTEAERLGMAPRDVRRLRHALDGRTVAPSVLVRVERELRAWFRERVPALRPPSTSPDAGGATDPL